MSWSFTRIIAAGSAALLLTACATKQAAPTAQPVAGNSFVLRDVRVFDGTRVHERVNVVVRDGRIVSLDRGRVRAGLPVIDGAGRTLLPGLINAHGHVPAEGSLRNALRFGVTTVLDMLTSPEFARSQRRLGRRDRLERTELADLFTAGAPVTSPRGMGTQFGIPFTTIGSAEEADSLVRERISSGSDHIKIMYEPDAGIVTTISPATLAAVIRAAHAHGLLAVVHVSSLAGARDAVAAGADGLAHSISNELIDDALVQQMRARGTFVVSTLSIVFAFNNTGFGGQLAADPRIAPYLTAGQRTELNKDGPGASSPMAGYLARFNVERGLENIRRMHKAGVRVLAGDDAPNLGAHGASLHGELELLTRAGMTPAEAITAATRAVADAFRLHDRGRIAAGARADMILVDGNPLEDITATRAIVRIFKNGYEVARERVAAAAVQNADEAKVRVVLARERKAGPLAPRPEFIHASLVRATPDTVVLRVHPTAAPIALPRAAIERIDVSRGLPGRLTSAGESAVRYAVLGSLERTLIAALFPNRYDEHTWESALTGAGYGVILGAVVGAVRPRERWARTAN